MSMVLAQILRPILHRHHPARGNTFAAGSTRRDDFRPGRRPQYRHGRDDAGRAAALIAVLASAATGSPAVGLLAALITGAALGWLMSLVNRLGTDLIMTGIALNIAAAAATTSVFLATGDKGMSGALKAALCQAFLVPFIGNNQYLTLPPFSLSRRSALMMRTRSAWWPRVPPGVDPVIGACRRYPYRPGADDGACPVRSLRRCSRCLSVARLCHMVCLEHDCRSRFHRDCSRSYGRVNRMGHACGKPGSRGG